jgi:diguanylate cyclase
MHAFADAFLTRDSAQRSPLLLTLLGLFGALVGACVVQVCVWVGWVSSDWGLAWSLLAVAGPMVFFVAIRLGWTRRLTDPALTFQQVLFAVTSSTTGYALVGPARGAMLVALVVAVAFGLAGLAPRRMAVVVVYAAVLFAVLGVVMVMRRPNQYPLTVELGHFVVVMSILGAMVMLSRHIARWRQRSRQTRTELTQALERLRDSSTRDELTGLINKRHMQSLVAQEHQRCIRSGQTFCLAMIAIGNLQALRAAHGTVVCNAVLRAVVDEALRQLRAADVLCRWSDDAFVVLMPDSRAMLARGGLERMTEKVSALRILHGDQALGVTLAGGLAEHLAGEAVTQTLSRAERALADAPGQGATRVLVAL